MTLEKIINFLNPISVNIISEDLIKEVKSVFDESFSHGSFGWCSDKNIDLIKEIKSGTLLISSQAEFILKDSNTELLFNRIVVENPRKAFASVLRTFFIEKKEFGKIYSSATIEKSVIYNSGTINIDPNVVIEEDVIIGNYVSIGANTVIKKGTVIHDNVTIGSNCTIGGVGFGYELNDDGIYEVIPHLGNVVLKEKVEIGNNVCIDRAVLGSTILEKEVKVDNLVHISHGVFIDENSLIIAHAMIAGSVQIGKNTWVAPCSSIKQKVIVGKNVTIGLGSVVLNNIPDNQIVVGVPAKNIQK